MALTTYTELQDGVKRWLWDREDLASRIPEFIALAESDFNDELQVGDMEATTTITLTSGSGSLPADYLIWRRVIDNIQPNCPLEWADPNWADDRYYALGNIPAPTRFFTVIGNTIKTYPSCANNLTLTYYQKIPPLSVSNPSNWLLARKPGVYLYGALMHAAPFLDDDERAQTWGALRKVEMDSLEARDVMSRYARASCKPMMVMP